MPESAVAAPPAPTPSPAPTPAPTPSSSPAPAAEKPTGINRAVAEMDAALARKPEAKPSVQPKADGKPTDDAKPDFDLATATEEQYDEAFKKAPPKWYKIYDGYKAKVGPKLKELQAAQTKLQQLESKPPSADNTAKIEVLEKQIKELEGTAKSREQRLIESDYARSDEYKKKYLDRYAKEKQTAIEEVKGLTVRYKEGDEDRQRPATEADFQKALRLPPGDQDAFIHETFGSSAFRVINRINEMNRIRSEASESVAQHTEAFQAKQIEDENLSKHERETFTKSRTEAHKALEEKWPALFSTKHYESDPDAKSKLEGGYAFVDKVDTDLEKMTPDDKAAFASVLRARAAAMPLADLLLTRAKAENDSLKAELAKYRGSDPGKEITDKGKGEGDDKKVGGIAAMAAKFDTR